MQGIKFPLFNKLNRQISGTTSAPDNSPRLKPEAEQDSFVSSASKVKKKKIRFCDTCEESRPLSRAFWGGNCQEQEKEYLLELLNDNLALYRKRKPLSKDVKVYRGVHSWRKDPYAEKFIDLLKNAEAGDRITLAPFETYVSVSKGIALDYAQVLFDIELPKGSKVVSGWNPIMLSKLLPPMAQVDVLSVEDVSSKKHKHLERIIKCRYVPSDLEPLKEFPVFENVEN